MPPTRSARLSSSSKSHQKPLAFASKVSKPHATLATKDKPHSSHRKTTPPATNTIQAGVPHEEAKKAPSPEEREALQITDAQIKRYWKGCEGERSAARVHQRGLPIEEKILRLWDVSSGFGPCIGITRLERWQRARRLGLNPPIEVLAVLLKEEERGRRGSERAYIDELMISKFVIGEA